MSLTVTQRPYQTIGSDTSKWNAVGNPILYKMQRKDFTFASITNAGGFVRLVLDSSFGNVSTSFDINDVVYFITDGGVYDTTGTVTASSYSAPNTLVTLSTAYISSSTGFVNNDYLRPSYRVEVEVYKSDNTQIGDSAFTYSPTSKGALTIDVSTILKSELLPDNEADLTGNDEYFDDENVYLGFYIKYREVWSGSAESQTDDSSNDFFGLLGAMQIPSIYGGNLYEYLILGDMKKAEITLTSSQILTGFTVPVTVVAAPGANKAIMPIGLFLKLPYNSVAYATNTDIKFTINGVSITGTISSFLSASATTWRLMGNFNPGNTTSSQENQPLLFSVLTGDPTAGNSTMKIVVLYTIVDF